MKSRGRSVAPLLVKVTMRFALAPGGTRAVSVVTLMSSAPFRSRCGRLSGVALGTSQAVWETTARRSAIFGPPQGVAFFSASSFTVACSACGVLVPVPVPAPPSGLVSSVPTMSSLSLLLPFLPSELSSECSGSWGGGLFMQAVSARRRGRLPATIRFMAPRLSLPPVTLHARFPCARRLRVGGARDFSSRHIFAVVLDSPVRRLGSFQVVLDVSNGGRLGRRHRRGPGSLVHGEVDIVFRDGFAVVGRRPPAAREAERRRGYREGDPEQAKGPIPQLASGYIAPMRRPMNFNAGPATLPLPALERARAEFLDFAGTGMSVMEHSHRGSEYEKVHDEAISLLRELLAIPDDYDVLFLQGGASMQFALI